MIVRFTRSIRLAYVCAVIAGAGALLGSPSSASAADNGKCTMHCDYCHCDINNVCTCDGCTWSCPLPT